MRPSEDAKNQKGNVFGNVRLRHAIPSKIISNASVMARRRGISEALYGISVTAAGQQLHRPVGIIPCVRI
jgi:hypothetical protein